MKSDNKKGRPETLPKLKRIPRSFAIDERTLERIAKYSEEKNISRSETIAVIVNKYLDREEKLAAKRATRAKTRDSKPGT